MYKPGGFRPLLSCVRMSIVLIMYSKNMLKRILNILCLLLQWGKFWMYLKKQNYKYLCMGEEKCVTRAFLAIRKNVMWCRKLSRKTVTLSFALKSAFQFDFKVTWFLQYLLTCSCQIWLSIHVLYLNFFLEN